MQRQPSIFIIPAQAGVTMGEGMVVPRPPDGMSIGSGRRDRMSQ